MHSTVQHRTGRDAARVNPDLDKLYPYPFTRLRALLADIEVSSAAPHISLAIGEPQHPPPGFVERALVSELASLQRYPAVQGSAALRAAIGDWLARRYAIERTAIDDQHMVLPVQGTREALFAAAQFIVDRGIVNSDKAEQSRPAPPLVMMPAPFYQIYEGAALMAGAAPHYMPGTAAQGFIADLDAVTPAAWQRCQLLYVCNPSNPTGVVLDSGYYQQLLELADRYDFVIASDECYSEIYPDEQRPCTGLLQACAERGRLDFARCLVFNSLSKRSNLAGLRSGFVAGDAALIKAFLLYRTYHGSAMPAHHQAASIAAWSDEQHVRDNRAQYRAKLNAVTGELRGVLDFVAPAGGFCLWTQTPVDDPQFAAGLY
ncbi:MAG: succinyldiaminopimelate transaminase, partial [Pseudomonadales bacterium]|nr:succinyldiaminopimelate transaminase [Pseudomonadales bacterium]